MIKLESGELDMERLARELEQWAASEEGQRFIKESLRSAADAVRCYREARYVDWRRLMEPMTI